VTNRERFLPGANLADSARVSSTPMPFPLRLQIAGAVYHVATRATGPTELFRDREDRVRLLRILEYVVEKYGWRVHAYCLMVTHYHLVVTTPEPNIARGMQLLNSVYARTFNERHGRLGHLVAARYSASLIESDGHALETCRYLPLNPVRSKLCAKPEQYRWSSYAATIGLRNAPAFLDSSWILELFGDELSTARKNLRAFVKSALVSETLEVA
jgi:putative transposase